VSCVFLFLGQQYTNKSLNDTLRYFCKQDTRISPKKFSPAIYKIALKNCERMLEKIYFSKNKSNSIKQVSLFFAKKHHMRPHGIYKQIESRYIRFASIAPEFNLTSYLKYESDSWNPWHMLTAVFAHNDWSHLILNLIHFIVFASMVEILLGKRNYIISFLLITYGSQLVYSLVFTLLKIPSETIGLSGVAMGMMGAAVVLFNSLKASHLPNSIFILVWSFVIAFIGINVYQAFPDQFDSEVNVVVHAVGAIIGLLIGLFTYKKIRLNNVFQKSS